MEKPFKNYTVYHLQWLIWAFVMIIIFISLLPMDGLLQAATFSVLNTFFYAAIIYGNISLLYPSLYERKQRTLYVLTVVLFLLIMGVLRAYLTWFLYTTYFSTRPEPFNYKIILNYSFGGIFLYLLSFIFRIALAYFDLKKQNEVILLQKANAELKLLKSQVQPHFLFNTLNNIYYEAYLEAPRTAHLIELLAEIMRYFTDESPKEQVALDTEVQFLESYIALEQIRIRDGVEMEFIKQYDPGLQIPPMLLITFIENIFKHGIDKSDRNERLQVSLTQEGNFLHFIAANPILGVARQEVGLGLKNLEQRLALLYPDNYTLQITTVNQVYRAYLKIPLQ